MADVFLAAATDHYRRHGIALDLPPREAVIRAYAHIEATGSCHVAECDGRIVSLAGAVVRESQWYLSAFWTLPEYQNRGFGGPLLQDAYRYGRDSGVRYSLVWSSIAPAAMASYMKLGLDRLCSMLLFEGKPKTAALAPDYADVSQLVGTVAENFDLVARGVRRPVDHALWATMDSMIGRQVHIDGKLVGYFYVNRGQVGPAAWSSVEHADVVLACACAAAGPDKTVRMSIPATNEAAIRFALDLGLRLVGHAHLMANDAFGRLECYLPSGPSLF